MLKAKSVKWLDPTKPKPKRNKSFGPSNWDENYTCLLPFDRDLQFYITIKIIRVSNVLFMFYSSLTPYISTLLMKNLYSIFIISENSQSL